MGVEGGGPAVRRVALIALLCALLPSAAAADDANTVPPQLELRASGTPEEPVGRHGGSLASYSTAEPDASWGYSEADDVSFTCLIDGQTAPCSRSYHRPCCPVAVALKRLPCPRRKGSPTPTRRRKPCKPTHPPAEPYIPEGKILGYGPFNGWVPIPSDLPNGTHTVTVIATDEDGTDPNPPTVTAAYDIVPPPPPEILSAPAPVSRDATPRFRYAAVDERKLYDTYNDPFSASLRRVKPPGREFHNGSPNDFYLEWNGPSCPLLLRCTEVSWPAYLTDLGNGSAEVHHEHLDPGLYEFSVSVTDTAFNKSAATTRRFRVLRPRGR